jgi:hypothetical protein
MVNTVKGSKVPNKSRRGKTPTSTKKTSGGQKKKSSSKRDSSKKKPKKKETTSKSQAKKKTSRGNSKPPRKEKSGRKSSASDGPKKRTGGGGGSSRASSRDKKKAAAAMEDETVEEDPVKAKLRQERALKKEQLELRKLAKKEEKTTEDVPVDYELRKVPMQQLLAAHLRKFLKEYPQPIKEPKKLSEAAQKKKQEREQKRREAQIAKGVNPDKKPRAPKTPQALRLTQLAYHMITRLAKECNQMVIALAWINMWTANRDTIVNLDVIHGASIIQLAPNFKILNNKLLTTYRQEYKEVAYRDAANKKRRDDEEASFKRAYPQITDEKKFKTAFSAHMKAKHDKLKADFKKKELDIKREIDEEQASDPEWSLARKKARAISAAKRKHFGDEGVVRGQRPFSASEFADDESILPTRARRPPNIGGKRFKKNPAGGESAAGGGATSNGGNSSSSSSAAATAAVANGSAECFDL